MEAVVIKIIGGLFTAIIIAYLGYIQGRWSKEKEILYSQKVNLYSDLVTEALEFTSLCSPNNKITTENYTQVITEFNKLQNSFYRASLFMPDELHNDIKVKFIPINDKLKKIHSIFIQLNRIKKGETKDVLDGVSFNDFKKQAIDALDNFNVLPGLFLPLIESMQNITKMLKKDLGISKIGNSFYTKNSR